MTSPLWTFDELVKATGGTLTGTGEAASATGINFDSRALQPGDIFLALKGVRDGHDFVPQAFQSGAVLAVTRRPIDGGPCLLVPDVQKALEDMAAFARGRAPQCRRGAVTGSVGKTSVTQMVMQGLLRAGRAHSAVKSFNNHIGVPLTLARMPRDTERAVFEIGMNHANEITPLSEFVAPHAVVITAVGAVHTENFPDGEAGVARAKAEIFDGLVPSGQNLGGLAILNADNAWFDYLSTCARGAGALVAAFGESGGVDARLTGHRLDGDHAVVEAKFHGRDIAFRLSHTGKHQAVNALATLLMLEALDVDLDTSIAALEGFAALDGRGKVADVPFRNGRITVIDESYNANPVSMTATLQSLGGRPKPVGSRKIVVLTDMLELGPDEAERHAALADVIAIEDIDSVYLAGPLMKHLWDALPARLRGAYAPAAADLVAPLIEGLHEGDVVMIKGSNGSKAGLVAKALLQPNQQAAS